MSSCWILTYAIDKSADRKTLVFCPPGGYAGTRGMVSAIVMAERPTLKFPFGKDDNLTVREVLRTYNICDTIRHRPDFSSEDAHLSTDEKSCALAEPLKVCYLDWLSVSSRVLRRKHLPNRR